MTPFSTQFHADPTEVADAVESWMKSHAITACAVRSPPFRATNLRIEEVQRAVGDPSIDFLAFMERLPVLEASTQGEFLDRNPGALLLDVGRMTTTGLRESCLSTMEATPVWKRINQDLKRRTMSGATALNESTGATSYIKTHRYARSALALFEAGVRMLPTAGSAVYQFSLEAQKNKG